MATAFQYRPRFRDIRVKPPVEGEADVNAVHAGERRCDSPDCLRTATARAPKSRDLLSEHYWFCQPHAAEYNRRWNFFAGLSESEVRERVETETLTGGRPTWSMKGGGRNREAAGTRGVFRDAFGMFGAGGPPNAAPTPDRRIGRLERNALNDLDLEPGVQGPAIRERYLELVKLCHPDANGGDRSAESRLQRVIKAYKTLQKAKLV